MVTSTRRDYVPDRMPPDRYLMGAAAPPHRVTGGGVGGAGNRDDQRLGPVAARSPTAQRTTGQSVLQRLPLGRNLFMQQVAYF